MSINLYPKTTIEADLTPTYTNDIDTTCNEIYKACKGWGTNEKKLNILLGTKTATERHLISHRYPELYNKRLLDLIKSETSGNYGQLLQFLSLPLDDAEALMIKKATAGLGTNEKLLYPIICGRSNTDMNILKKAYYKLYGKDLVMTLNSELSGNFKALLVNCAQAAEDEFDPTYHTQEKALEDAKAFYKAGQGRWGTDEKALFRIICFSPPRHLEAVNQAYANQYGYTLSKALQKELSGLVKKTALFTLGMKLNPHETIALLVKSTCAGIGTDELGLSACMVRYQEHIQKIMIVHEELFGKTLTDRIRSETSGNYCDVLLKLTGLV